jgi:hypothetical protein
MLGNIIKVIAALLFWGIVLPIAFVITTIFPSPPGQTDWNVKAPFRKAH